MDKRDKLPYRQLGYWIRLLSPAAGALDRVQIWSNMSAKPSAPQFKTHIMYRNFTKAGTCLLPQRLPGKCMIQCPPLVKPPGESSVVDTKRLLRRSAEPSVGCAQPCAFLDPFLQACRRSGRSMTGRKYRRSPNSCLTFTDCGRPSRTQQSTGELSGKEFPASDPRGTLRQLTYNL